MTTLAACPICGTGRPANRLSDGPWCCSITCYRAFHGIDRNPEFIDELLDREVIA